MTKYVAQRMIERERALSETAMPLTGDVRREAFSSAVDDGGARSGRSSSVCSPALAVLIALALLLPGPR